ncbi:hypothetical protein MSAR_08120 [Mycolicibacterium sarraceniae]|uniref:Uncharacterized protein n=1 Tax=Mycolicibacterium sarraceniae TaxID=1534348 RepID=A0A7I7SPB1_9MYCO|nr:hypothetical protein MSAR_08120 [Mycolicibacterium sarraceniae]
MKSLPPFAETKAQLEDAIATITTAATQHVPSIVWKTADNADSGNCPAPYEQSGGKSAYLPNRIAENVTVSEQDWAALLGVAEDAAGAVGATDIQVMQDEPGKRECGPAGRAAHSSRSSTRAIRSCPAIPAAGCRSGRMRFAKERGVLVCAKGVVHTRCSR